jgi:hypothetical protein
MSDALRFGSLWYAGPNAVSNAIDYAKFRSRSHRAVIRVYGEAGNRDRDARARRRFQKVVSPTYFGLPRRDGWRYKVAGET